MFICSALGSKYLFLNLIQQIEIVHLKINMVFRLIQICLSQWGCSFVLFLTKKTFFAKFGPKNKYFPIKMKVCTEIHSNMMNSMMMLICPVLWRNAHFLKNWTKILKLFDEDKTWYLHVFKYAELNGNIHFPCFQQRRYIRGKFGLKTENCLSFQKS